MAGKANHNQINSERLLGRDQCFEESEIGSVRKRFLEEGACGMGLVGFPWGELEGGSPWTIHSRDRRYRAHPGNGDNPRRSGGVEAGRE